MKHEHLVSANCSSSVFLGKRPAEEEIDYISRKRTSPDAFNEEVSAALEDNSSSNCDKTSSYSSNHDKTSNYPSNHDKTSNSFSNYDKTSNLSSNCDKTSKGENTDFPSHPPRHLIDEASASIKSHSKAVALITSSHEDDDDDAVDDVEDIPLHRSKGYRSNLDKIAINSIQPEEKSACLAIAENPEDNCEELLCQNLSIAGPSTSQDKLPLNATKSFASVETLRRFLAKDAFDEPMETMPSISADGIHKKSRVSSSKPSRSVFPRSNHEPMDVVPLAKSISENKAAGKTISSVAPFESKHNLLSKSKLPHQNPFKHLSLPISSKPGTIFSSRLSPPSLNASNLLYKFKQSALNGHEPMDVSYQPISSIRPISSINSISSNSSISSMSSMSSISSISSMPEPMDFSDTHVLHHTLPTTFLGLKPLTEEDIEMTPV